MGTISKIAKNELRHLFYSPVGWFLAIVMLVVSGFFYTNAMYHYAKIMDMINQHQSGQKHMMIDSLTAQLFGLSGGFFTNMMQQLFFFVPLLTMNVINKEFNNGTIKLLYSSPVKLIHIVLGKYLAMVVYCLMLISISGIFIILGFADIKSLDWPPLLSALLGLFLYLSALTAIGFFMSSLTRYQIVAAIASFTLLFVLGRIGTLWQEYDLVRDITWFLSMAGRTSKMIIGLITTKDILYFLVIIFMFIGFTYLKMRAELERKAWYISIAMYCSVVIVGLTIGYIGSRPSNTLYWDTTAQQIRTVHPRTQEIIQQLNNGPLEVTLYTNILSKTALQGVPRQRNFYLTNFWEQYQRFKPDIHFKYEYYYALPENDPVAMGHFKKSYPDKSPQQIAGIIAKSSRLDSTLFKPLSDIDDREILQSEDYNLIMKLNYNGRISLLRTFFEDGKSWGTQQSVNAALRRLLDTTMPQVFFVTGQLERSIYKKGTREYNTLTLNKIKVASLVNNGFDTDTLNLNFQDIPVNTSILVLPDPKVELAETVREKLQQYVASGGNMIIMGEPGKQQVTNPLLQQLGVQLREGQLVEPGTEESPEKVVHYATKATLDLADEDFYIRIKHLWGHGAKKDSALLRLSGVTSITVTGDSDFEVQPLLMTRTDKSWQKAGKLVSDSTLPIFAPQDGDVKETSNTSGVKLSRKIQNKEQRIVVTGDADIHSNGAGNVEFTRAIYSWLTYNKYPVYTPYPYAKDTELLLEPKRAAIQRIVFIWVLPALVLLMAMIKLVRRKRK